MEQETCGICGKIIIGYNPKHVAYLMEQHNLKHRKEEIQSNAELNIKGGKINDKHRIMDRNPEELS